MSSVLPELETILDHTFSSGESDLLVEHLLKTLSAMSLNSEFCDDILINHPLILVRIFTRYIETVSGSTKSALDFFINVTSHPGNSSKLSKIVPNGNGKRFSDHVITLILLMLDSSDAYLKSKSAQLLWNVTRENEEIIELSEPNLNIYDHLFRVGLLISSNAPEGLREDAAVIVMNLSQHTSIQKFIMDNLHYLNDLLEILKNQPSEKWTFACFGLLKNLLKNSGFHEDLLQKTDLLTILLYPLVGLNEYDDSIMSKFPDKLKEFVGKSRHTSPDIRSIILEALYLLCATKSARIAVRDSNVYDILKNISSLDLTDDESNNCLDCIGLLIRYEHEIECDDLLSLKIPKDMEEKLIK